MERMDTFQIGKNGKYRSLDVLLSIEVGYSTKVENWMDVGKGNNGKKR